MADSVGNEIDAPSIAWHNVESWGVNGKGWTDTLSYYDRLPARAEGKVRQVVWDLSRNSAGLYAEFETDSPAIHVRYNLTLERLAMVHISATGISGVDLYAIDDNGKWGWVSSGKPNKTAMEEKLVDGLKPGYRRYRLYLPLYNGVTSVEVGVNEGARFTPVAPSNQKPIVYYGTSITQGAAASRAGMAFTAILGRRLGIPIINLGFSGNAQMEPEVAELVAELDPVMFVLDAFPNMNAERIDANFEHFVRTLRNSRPTTPIVVVEDRAYTNTPFIPARQEHYIKTTASIQAVWNRLLEDGMQNLHLISRDNLFGDDNEATVDSSHPTDLGMMRYADVVEPVLRGILRRW